MMIDCPRLIEVAFPLKQASLDSVHEKNVRHGHISTLHIWPARRPLAACRAALIATLLPDPGDPEERKRLLERLGGRVVEVVKRKKMPNGKIEEVVSEETVGGILHWGRESGPDLDWFRSKIREAYGGRAPKVLDPFAGGGAIPLEAMRLGCEATAMDINPVAWFLLKCTLEYPQKLAGQKRPLPDFVLRDREFMEAFLEAHGLKGAALRTQLDRLGSGEAQRDLPDGFSKGVSLEADLAWHVRAWGRWVLQRAKAELEPFYPVVDGKPTVAYLWARTVTCKNPSCGATIPLLKTRWLCKKEKKRVLLTMEPNAERTGVLFGIQTDVPLAEGNAAQRREHDRRVGVGTMSRAGASCPSCGTIMASDDLRHQARSGRMGTVMTAVVADDEGGKEYRAPTADESEVVLRAGRQLPRVFASVPFGLPTESVPQGGSRSGGGSPFTVHIYGLDQWHKLFTHRQLLSLGTFLQRTRDALDAMIAEGYPPEWVEAITALLATGLDKLADRLSSLCRWDIGYTKISNTFARFALPILWDFCEGNPLSSTTGNYSSCLEWVAESVEHGMRAVAHTPGASVVLSSACDSALEGQFDLIVTDPPYYDAIPYSDLMDFFYVWLRRSVRGVSPALDEAFRLPLSPKWDHERDDGELIDDPSRFGGEAAESRKAYENGMFRAFRTCFHNLTAQGYMVVVFANKQPDAWESLASSMIRAGFVVDGSWPIQTEMGNRTRSLSSAALSSSVWLVCRKRLSRLQEVPRPFIWMPRSMPSQVSC